MQKTNAMRFLDKNKIPYNTYEYDCKDGKIDGSPTLSVQECCSGVNFDLSA